MTWRATLLLAVLCVGIETNGLLGWDMDFADESCTVFADSDFFTAPQECSGNEEDGYGKWLCDNATLVGYSGCDSLCTTCSDITREPTKCKSGTYSGCSEDYPRPSKTITTISYFGKHCTGQVYGTTVPADQCASDDNGAYVIYTYNAAENTIIQTACEDTKCKLNCEVQRFKSGACTSISGNGYILEYNK
eukprot:TRINITY_DN19455_c0_g1_i1.p1 TRINITY_DN19455_c0_g1~~TRINITY_DN19455_c0_g1_i1.p1  ORF type:complete len:191 (-),score=4.83 TRINITY_DN19455_c0_g1_i1:167-739(-)